MASYFFYFGIIKLIRFPNPGSDLFYFFKIFVSLHSNLAKSESFNLDDMSNTLTSMNLASSGGYIGKEALQSSTRKDRSRDPLYNQSKMYAELYRHLGWVLPGENKLNFTFTALGQLAHACIEEPKKTSFIRQSLLGIEFPNINMSTKSHLKNRPFKTILEVMNRLDNQITKDEIILGPLSIADDTDQKEIDKTVEYILKIRSGDLDLEKELKEKAKKEQVQVNTLQNYTRFPIGAIKGVGWIKKSRIGKKVIFKLTQDGIDEIKSLKNVSDLRAADICNYNNSKLENLSNKALRNFAKRSGVADEDFQRIIDIETKTNEGDENILFSPFHSIDASFFYKKDKVTKSDTLINAVNKNYRVSILESHLNDVDSRSEVRKTSLNSYLEDEFTKKTYKSAISTIKEEYKNANQEVFYPLVSDLLVNLDLNCKLSRHGINYQRHDAILLLKDDSIPIEIKSPGEEIKIGVKAVRQALENKIIIQSRETYPNKRDTSALIVGYEYPNKRSEVNRLILDIFNTYNIRIGMIDLENLIKLNFNKFINNKKPDPNDLIKLIGRASKNI